MQEIPDHGMDSYQGSGRPEGKTAIITGGDSGIGRAVAIAFAPRSKMTKAVLEKALSR